MAQFVTDTFTNTDGVTLSTHDANWIKVTGFTDNLQIISNRLRVSASGGTTAVYRYSTTPASEDYEVTNTFVNVAGSDTSLNTGVVARASSSQQTLYMARWRASNGFSLFKFVNSATATQLGSSVAQSYGVGATGKVRLRVEGSTISVYRNDETSPIISVTDTSITAAGFAGVWQNNYQAADGPQITEFSADTLGSSAQTISISQATETNVAQSITVTLSGGVLTTPALKNNTGTLLANETGATVYVYNAITGALVATKIGQTTNASGVMVITDPLIVAATQYRIVIVLGSGAEGMDKLTAT